MSDEVNYKTLGWGAIRWIQDYCCVPSGPNRGDHVKLTSVEKDMILSIYDALPDPRSDLPVDDPTLAAYLTLLHLASKAAAKRETFRPATIDVDVFTVWNAAGPELRQWIERKGESVVCTPLGTSYPPVAA
jgi:hypothetical protein